ncbi:MAG: hypothetical protein J6U10_03900, partial [Lachnospiraceae bacterium]|nr:hypothetical protein [Lachnospiraceae bacterium]
MKRDTLLKRTSLGILAGILLVTLLTVLKVPLSGYAVACAIYAGTVFALESYYRKRSVKKRKEMREIDEFFSAVRHEFHTHGMAGEAVRDAGLMQKSAFIRREAERIAEVLEAEDINAAADEYRASANNRYLKLFLTLCVTVEEYGDKNTGEGSVFLKNIMDLKEELRLEAEADELLGSKTAGICLVSAAPAFCLKMIENWSTGNLPEMSGFYKGRSGVTMLAVLFSLSVAVYAINYLLRGINNDMTVRRSFFERVGLPRAMIPFLSWTERTFRRYSAYQARLIAGAGLIMTPGKLMFFKFSAGFMVISAFSAAYLCALFTNEAMPYLLFVVFLLVLCCVLPDLLLIVFAYLNRLRMDEEVMQYQTIISMLSNIEFISVYEILEELEHFAIIFRRNISDCLNDFNLGEEKALLALSGSGNAQLGRLSERLAMCDRIGVKNAMDELAADRDHYIKSRERKTGENVKKRAVLGQFLAFIPLIASVALYLIIP